MVKCRPNDSVQSTFMAYLAAIAAANKTEAAVEATVRTRFQNVQSLRQLAQIGATALLANSPVAPEPSPDETTFPRREAVRKQKPHMLGPIKDGVRSC
jgi:hypothetical protein